jgi:hypothetical protein
MHQPEEFTEELRRNLMMSYILKMAVDVKFSGEIGGLKLSALKFSLEFGIWNLKVEIPISRLF